MKPKQCFLLLVLSCFGVVAMADQDAFRERSKELFADHGKYQEISLFFNFPNFFLEFELAYERVLSRGLTPEQVTRMRFDRDPKMSSAGLSVLREAFQNEADGQTQDLRARDPYLDKLCDVIDTADAQTVSVLNQRAGDALIKARLGRYNKILNSLSDEDRAVLDMVYFDRDKGLMKLPPRPMDAEPLIRTLAEEFPEQALNTARKACAEHQATKGKRMVMYHEDGPSNASDGDTGEPKLAVRSVSSGYKLVDMGSDD
jgi:hypothetical protein